VTTAVSRAIVTPDKHFPNADQPAINVLCKAIDFIKPTIYVDLGDVGEWENFSHWKYARRKQPPLEFMIPGLETDIIEVNKGIDQIDEALDRVNCTEKYMIEGNHDNWLNTFCDAHSYIPSSKKSTIAKACAQLTLLLSSQSLPLLKSFKQPIDQAALGPSICVAVICCKSCQCPYITLHPNFRR